MEKMVHFRAISTLIDQRRIAAIERRIQVPRQQIREIISMLEEREQ